MRITDHPILGPLPQQRRVIIYYNNKPIEAYEGEPIAVALLAAGIRNLRITDKKREPRGIFCCIGRCSDCLVTVNGENVRSCITPVEEGAHIESQS
ncbi:MAG: (2Fe-2S)-binding protein [Thermoanaerobacteraceae bacterium]|nr:(2Fe-2S)-binding protein [Thermoanaerobacteraceae bacterium]